MWGQPLITNMEQGDPTVSLDVLVRALLALGVSQADLAQRLTPRAEGDRRAS